MKTIDLMLFGFNCAFWSCSIYLLLSTRNWKLIKRYWITKLTGNVKWYCHWCYREQNDPSYLYYKRLETEDGGICEHCAWLNKQYTETNWADFYKPVRELGLHKEGE